MNRRISTVSISGEFEETVTRLAQHLGKDKMRRKVFDAVYGRGTKPRSKKQIMDSLGLDLKYAQQLQNALDHLSKHNLILKSENDGSVGDRSRNLYSKDEVVRANRSAIVRFADNPKLADKVPTMRRPILKVVHSLRSVSKGELVSKKHLNILYLTADPDQAHALNVDVEVRRVQEEIRASKFRDNISVDYKPAADLSSLVHGLNDNRPQIVHFSGHGNRKGLLVDKALDTNSAPGALSFSLLAKALSATDNPPSVVVLNACKTSGVARYLFNSRNKRLARVLVAMKNPIGDGAAVAFAKNFYAALAAGQSVKSAFEQGKVAIEAESIGEAETPQMLSSKGVNPSRLFLV